MAFRRRPGLSIGFPAMGSFSLAQASFDRERHLPLLLEADDVEEHIHGYLDRGQLFEIRDAETLIGVAVLVVDGDACEIWNIALAEEHRGHGSGRRAIELIAGECREQGSSRLTVGTSDCSLGTIAFYRKVGFRFAEVRKGYFDDYPVAVVENGIRARDMVMFEMELVDSSSS
jgi:ribosomal protein S18 acetylase RimI-like enzyme